MFVQGVSVIAAQMQAVALGDEVPRLVVAGEHLHVGIRLRGITPLTDVERDQWVLWLSRLGA